MSRFATLLMLLVPAVAVAAPLQPVTRAEIDAVPCNAAGWPLKTYVVFAGTQGAGANAGGHNVAYGILQRGWTGYVDEQLQPLLDGPNPPARIVVHCIGPAWPRMREDGPWIPKNTGRVVRWFEYDWPLTVAQGREREDGKGRWPPLPKYVDDFAPAWRSVADGSRSDGFPVEVYAYTGLIQTPWLEELREADPSAYRERLVRVAEFFRDAGFAGMWVDASASPTLEPDHLGLRVLKEIDDWPDFFVGVEAYPPKKHDTVTGPLRYFIIHGTLKYQHPRFPECRTRAWQSELPRDGLVVWLNQWGGGAYRLTPETARLTAAMGADIGVSWVRWKDLAPQLPPQQLRLEGIALPKE